jgi:membrane-associated protein
MDFIAKVVDFVLHLDTHLSGLIQTYGFWTYLILFLIIFCETGLVVTPFLPRSTSFGCS